MSNLNPKIATHKWILDHADHGGEACLVWPWFRDPDSGYGRLGINRTIGFAHRVMCELVNGAPPLGHEAAHNCGNGRGGCVHPKHLEWKTRSQNQLDRRAHGTATTNRYGRTGKLTAVDRAEIISLRGKVTQRVLAKRFGVHFETISRVQRTASRCR